MSNVTLTGTIVAAQQLFDNGSFKKQTYIVEVVNNNYSSFFPVEFHQQDVQNLTPQLQPNVMYTFSGFMQGSKNQTVDKNGQPSAYLSFKCTSVVQAGQQQPQQPVNNFQNNAAPQNNFPQNNGGFVGNPPAQQQNFPQNNGNNFQNNGQAPAQNNGFAQQPQNNAFNNGFPNTNTAAPAQANDPFNQNGGNAPAQGQFNNF